MATNKRINIEPLARVEGHGGITVDIENNEITNVKVNILEGPRLFETLVIGKTAQENLSIVPRICAICNLSHKYAALRGLEKALGIKVPPKVQWMRSLMHLGECLESHSLHVYILALPDFFGYPSVISMLDKYGEEVTGALTLKKFANMIMKTI